MAFDWNNLIFVAKYLNVNCEKLSERNGECIDREATFRTVINRAYYAAFNVAIEFAIKKFGKLEKNDEERQEGLHSKLIRTFRKHEKDNELYADIAVKLGRIKNCRVDADYKPKFREGHPNFTAQLTMNFSERIISTIDSIK